MNYFRFSGWLFFMTWIISDSIPRYVTPHLHSIYDTFEELERGAWNTGRLGAPLSLTLQIILSFALAYILSTWSVWCLLRCFSYTRVPETSRALYFLTGFVCCEYALGKMAKADRYRGFFMSVFHFSISMGTFVVFSMNPLQLKTYFPWLLRLMGMEF